MVIRGRIKPRDTRLTVAEVQEFLLMSGMAVLAYDRRAWGNSKGRFGGEMGMGSVAGGDARVGEEALRDGIVQVE